LRDVGARHDGDARALEQLREERSHLVVDRGLARREGSVEIEDHEGDRALEAFGRGAGG